MLGVVLSALVASMALQEAPLFTEQFPPEEFRERRERVFDAIGDGALAVLQGAPAPHSSARFRQSNQFFYLSGVEAPNAYLVLDGARRRAALYLRHLDSRRSGIDGATLSASEPEQARSITGVEEVHGHELLAEHLGRYTHARRSPQRVLYTPFQPGEGTCESRDGALRAVADAQSDPWGGGASAEGRFRDLLAARFPQFELRDLSPILDWLRLIKTAREIKAIRKATELSGLALMEAMRSTAPGVREYELEALARFIFRRGGAQADAYTAIVASGPNAWYQHYRAGSREMKDGELVVMDFAPDVGYYRSDLTRTWPVNGKFTGWQRELYGFYLGCYRAVLRAIRPGSTAQEIMKNVATEMERVRAGARFSKSIYADAASQFVADYRKASEDPKARLGHWIGMATHDVGSDPGPLRSGMVFTIEPAFRVPEEKIYIRNEDAILITEKGATVLSGFVPMGLDSIESLMLENGLLQRFPQPAVPESTR